MVPSVVRRVAIAVFILRCALGCASTSPPPARVAEPARPSNTTRLVVLLVIDQWPEWAFEAKRPALSAGFERLLREGTWHIGQHPTPATLTAVGHAVLGTGEPPSRSGIIANEWWHRGLERSVLSVQAEDGSATAKWLRVPGLGDAVAAVRAGGKAVSVSLKDRAAILPLGHAGLAIWYDARRVAWTSLAAPPWLAAWNTSRPIAAHLHDVWTPLPETPQLARLPDDAPGEVGMVGLGPTFPHALDAAPDPATAIFATPLGNDLVLDTATAAVEHEQLGADDRPDLLVISLSAHDFIGHGWGQESWESWDAMLRLDRRLDQFLSDLDARVGAGRWSMIVTSDHGACPMSGPLHRGRVSYAQIKDAANRAAIAELGPGEWIANVGYPTVYLSSAALAQKPRDVAMAITKIVYALRSFPGLSRVERSAELWGRCDTRTGDALLICLMLDPERSGEVVYLPAPGWIVEDGVNAIATSHGSLQPYDRLVPVIELAPGRAPHPALTAPDAPIVPMVEIASVIAGWLGVPAPSSLRPPR